MNMSEFWQCFVIHLPKIYNNCIYQALCLNNQVYSWLVKRGIKQCENLHYNYAMPEDYLTGFRKYNNSFLNVQAS